MRIVKPKDVGISLYLVAISLHFLLMRERGVCVCLYVPLQLKDYSLSLHVSHSPAQSSFCTHCSKFLRSQKSKSHKEWGNISKYLWLYKSENSLLNVLVHFLLKYQTATSWYSIMKPICAHNWLDLTSFSQVFWDDNSKWRTKTPFPPCFDPSWSSICMKRPIRWGRKIIS